MTNNYLTPEARDRLLAALAAGTENATFPGGPRAQDPVTQFRRATANDVAQLGGIPGNSLRSYEAGNSRPAPALDELERLLGGPARAK